MYYSLKNLALITLYIHRNHYKLHYLMFISSMVPFELGVSIPKHKKKKKKTLLNFNLNPTQSVL